MLPSDIEFLVPEWPAPENVKSMVTKRSGGYSCAPYASFNVAAHVSDDPNTVNLNRELLYKKVGLPITWLNQTHSTDVILLERATQNPQSGDAVFSRQGKVVCSVMTADCLPILVCDVGGEEVAAIHAGWRGLADGIVTETIKYFSAPADELLVYLGPAISQPYFEVGEDVRQIFAHAELMRPYAESMSSAFSLREGGKYYADMYRVARSELNALGVTAVFGGDQCTFRQKDDYFSFRRDNITGRMASLIWLSN